MTITIVIADDHHAVLIGLRLLLESEPDFKVIGEASNGRDAVHQVNVLHPTVVILDVDMPELNGIEAARQICCEAPETKVIMFSMHETSEHVYQAIRAGARGYVLKECAYVELIQAIRTVHIGQRHVSQKITNRLTNYPLI